MCKQFAVKFARAFIGILLDGEILIFSLIYFDYLKTVHCIIIMMNYANMKIYGEKLLISNYALTLCKSI